MRGNRASGKSLLLSIGAALAAAAGLWLAALAGAEQQPTVRQAGYTDTCDSPTQSEDTEITKGPKKKTEKKKAKFEFVGFFCRTGDVDDQDNYEFECTLDKGAEKSCTSPQKYRGLKKGKHRFSVRAHFPNSPGDPTPAVYKWKIRG